MQQVVANLHISRIQLKTEDDNDIRAYTHERKVEKVVVKLGDLLKNVQSQYFKVNLTLVS